MILPSHMLPHDPRVRPSSAARFFALLVAFALLGACTGAATPSAAPTVASSPTPSASAPATDRPAPPTPSGSPTNAAVAIDAPWAQVELTDVRTGERFRIADLAGRVIVIEPMAVWCTNCKAQQREGATLLAELPDVAWIALDIDPRESPDLLAGAAAERGHPFRWAIAPAELSRGLEADFGTIVLNPVPTPLILIGTDGRITLTDFGLKDAGTLVDLARQHGA